MSKFNERLKALRKAQGLTQLDMALKFEISPNTWSTYETGLREPNMDNLNKIAEFFNVSLDYLMGRTDDKNRTFSPMTRDFLDLLETADEKLFEKRTILIDGRPVTKEELMQFIIQVRLTRQLKELGQKQSQTPPPDPE